MRHARSAVLLVSLLASTAIAAEGADGERIPLKAKSFRQFDLVLPVAPADRFQAVGDGIPISHQGGGRFVAKMDGSALFLDTDGDGIPDTRISGKKVDGVGQVAFTILAGTSRDGQPFRYAVRLEDRGAGWRWAASGARAGKIGETRVLIVDQNGNGRFSDVGEDAMIVGPGKTACYLSEVVSIGGALKRIDVAADGAWLAVTSFEGETGVLDLTSGLDAQARALSCVLKSADGRHSFDFAQVLGGMRVPAGVYNFEGGLIGRGNDTVRVSAGRTRTIRLAANEEKTVRWGNPVRAEFSYRRAGAQVAFHPEDIRYFGAAGEEYVDFTPFGASPEFAVAVPKEDGRGVEIETAIFGGC